GLPLRWCALTHENAVQALRMRLLRRAGVQLNFEALREALGLPETPQRIECFDISHTAGEGTVGACVVFGPEGPIKSDYRRYNIRPAIGPGDDYAAKRGGPQRRFRRVERGDNPSPDLVLVQGG